MKKSTPAAILENIKQAQTPFVLSKDSAGQAAG